MSRTARTRLAYAAAAATATMLFASSALAGDHCRLDAGSKSATYSLPSVTGAYGDHSWGNASTRRLEENLEQDLGSTNVTLAYIQAYDSPVALYWYTGGGFDKDVHYYLCRKGYRCAIDSLGDFKSFSCQREFGYKAHGNALAAAINPIIPTESFIAPIAAKFKSAMNANSRVDHYHQGSTKIYWITQRDTEVQLWDAPKTWAMRYTDDLKLEKKFELNVDGSLKDYSIKVSVYLRPQLINKEFRFTYVGKKVSVESGLLDDLIKKGVTNGLDGPDMASELDRAVRVEAGKSFCEKTNRTCTEQQAYDSGKAFLANKERLQLSYLADFDPAVKVSGGGEVSSLSPFIVLNSTRDD